MAIHRYVKYFIVFVSFFVLNRNMNMVSANPSNELLHYLTKKTFEARQKISSASYRVESHSELETKKGRRIDNGQGFVKLQGNCIWSAFENDAQISSICWQQKQTPRVVLNDGYLGYWPSVGNTYAYRADHNSIEMMTEHNRIIFRGLSAPDYQLLNICYQGFENSSFAEQIKLFPDKIRWETIKKKKDNNNIYEIRRFSPYMKDISKADAIWTIEGDKGFLITERVCFTKDGNVSEDVKIEVKEILPDIWFPVAFWNKRFSYDKSKNFVDTNSTVLLKEIQLNIPIPREQFEMASLDLPKSITIFWTDLHNETIAWVYDGDKLVKRDEFLKKQRKEKNIEQTNLQQTLIDKKAPPLKVENWVQGEAITLDKLKGRYVLLDFFGEWCVPCRRTYPLLVKEYNSRRPEDLIIIGIHPPGSTQEDIQSLLKRYDIKYSVAIDKSLADKEYFGETSAEYLIKSIPHAVLIDRAGNVIGHGNVEEVIKILEKNLL